MRDCLLIKLKLLFLNSKSYSLWCGLDILTVSFLSGHMVSKNFKLFCVVLMSSIPTSNLVIVKNSKIITDLHVTSTDCHQYLHYLSAHPNHTKRSAVFSQTLRISRLCSYEENFIKHKANTKSQFFRREYPERLIFAKMEKVMFSNIERRIYSKTQKGIPLVVTYHPLLKSLSSIVIIIFTYYIWIKKLRGHLLHNIWFLTGVRVSLAVNLLGLKYIQQKGEQDRVSVRVNAAKFVKMYQRLIPLLVVMIKLLTK